MEETEMVNAMVNNRVCLDEGSFIFLPTWSRVQ